MTEPGVAADAQYTVQAVQDNAERLGLIWKRKRATVTSIGGPVMAILDADTEPIAVTSMIGVVAVDQRVYVDVVPPSGNFISGLIGAEPTPAIIGAHIARGLSAQALPNGAPTVVDWDLELFDTDGFSSLPSTIGATIPAGLGGLYTLTASVEMTATGTRNFGTILINGVRFVRSSLDPGEDFIGIAGTRTLVAGDAIQVDAFQNSGGGASMIAELWLFKIG